MLHRTTWLAIPVIGLVTIGSGVGWWGYDQFRQRQAISNQAENLYAGAFHSFVNDMGELESAIHKSLITGSQKSFQTYTRDMFTLSFAAQNEIAKLPVDLMPMHHAQQFLSDVESASNTWSTTSTNSRDQNVQKRLQEFYRASISVEKSLESLQSKILDNHLSWVVARQALSQGTKDNQIIDGFRKVDGATEVMVELADSPNSMLKQRKNVFATEKPISRTTAIKKVNSFLGNQQRTWNVKRILASGNIAEYVLASTDNQTWRATITVFGGHILSAHHSRELKGHHYDFSDAQNEGKQWLINKGFGNCSVSVANQYDGIAYFIFTPMWENTPVISRGITMKIALDNGEVVDFDATNYYEHPLTDVPERRLTSTQLRKNLNPGVRVEMSKSVILLNAQHQFRPAEAFYVTSGGDTYCIYLDANSGEEISVEQLTMT